MSFWSTISYKIKEIMKSMIGARTIEQTLHVSPSISSQMEEAIQLWSDMYKNQAPWLQEPSAVDPVRVTSLGIPAMIASEKARTALIEFNSEITTPTKEVVRKNPEYTDYLNKTNEENGSGEEVSFITSPPPETIIRERPVSDTTRATYMNEQYEKLKRKLRTQIEYGIAKGGLIIKPYVILSEPNEDATASVDSDYQVADIEFDFIQADAFYPLAFDAAGKITEAAFIQTKTEKDIIYRRLEYHKFENHTLQVVNKAFRSTSCTTDSDMSGLDLGQEVPLTEVPEWKDLQPTVTIANVDRPLFAYFKMPEANIIDTASPLGVSGFSRAVNLIKDADMQYSRLLWEYEAGEMAIDIDRDALNFIEGGTDRNGNSIAGHSVLGKMQQRLYRKVDLGDENTYEQYAPTLRDGSFLEGLNTILMRIEDTTGLSRGTLSDASAEAKTATELKILKQRSYQTNADIQQAIETCLRDVIYIMDAYCDIYNLTPDGEYEVNFEWDDSIITDVDAELNKRITLMNNGLASKIETRMWYFGETELQAQEALMQINAENQRAVEDNLFEQINLARINGNNK